MKERCSEFVPASDVLLLRLDVLGPESTLQAAALAAFDAFEGAGVDYIFHNAGASQHAVVEETSVAVATQLLNLNLHAAVNVARVTLPYMLDKGKGWHVVISSMAGVVPSPGQAVYAAAKAGLRAYFGSLKAELAGSGIGATICCPGPVAPGLDGHARLVYGPEGLVEALDATVGAVGGAPDAAPPARRPPKGRVAVPRAVELIIRAAHRQMDEVWIARHPVLLIGYMTQLWPSLAWTLLKIIGPARAHSLKHGADAYDARRLILAGLTGRGAGIRRPSQASTIDEGLSPRTPLAAHHATTS